MCKSVQPDETTNVETTFCLRLKGPAEVYASAVMTQEHMTQVYKEKVTPVTLGVTRKMTKHLETGWNLHCKKMTCRGLRNSVPVESENI